MSASRAWAEIDFGAVRNDIRELKRRTDLSRLMADAYGHGAVPVAKSGRAGTTFRRVRV